MIFLESLYIYTGEKWKIDSEWSVFLYSSDCIGVNPLSVPSGVLTNSYKNFTLKFYK